MGPAERKELWKAAQERTSAKTPRFERTQSVFDSQDLDSSTAKEVVIDSSSQGPIRFKPRMPCSRDTVCSTVFFVPPADLAVVAQAAFEFR